MKDAIKEPVIYRTILFTVLCIGCVPSFGDVDYFFQLNVAKITLFQYSLLALLGSFTLFFGTLLYNKFFQDFEVRTVYFFAMCISLVGTTTTLLQYRRINLQWGIPDLHFVIATNVVTNTLTTAFFLLPTLSIYSRLTPKKIEATVYALLTSTFNLSSEVISGMLGSVITKWYGITDKNLDQAYKLVYIQLGFLIMTFPLLYLVPLRKEVDEKIAVLNKKEDKR